MGERAGLVAKTPEVKKEISNSRVQRSKRLQSMNTPVGRILFLQRTAGNQVVTRLMRSGALQAKLRIGQPGDAYEQEADRVADAVMRMPEPGVQRQVDEEEEEEETLQSKPLASQITPLVQVQRQEEPEEEEEETLQAKPLVEEITPLVQRQVEPEEEEEPGEEEEEKELHAKSKAGTTLTVTPNIESRINSLKGGGQPLDPATRNFFEPRIGHDFSEVRVHHGSQAAEIARSVSARAFTRGQDIVFGAGQYAPGMRTGRQLLAHELAHVLQQSGQARRPVQMRRDGIYGIQRKVTVSGKRWTPKIGQIFVWRRFRRNIRVRDKVWLRFRSQFSPKYHFFYYNKAVLMSNLKYFARLGNKKYRDFVEGHRLAATLRHPEKPPVTMGQESDKSSYRKVIIANKAYNLYLRDISYFNPDPRFINTVRKKWLRILNRYSVGYMKDTAYITISDMKYDTQSDFKLWLKNVIEETWKKGDNPKLLAKRMNELDDELKAAKRLVKKFDNPVSFLGKSWIKDFHKIRHDNVNSFMEAGSWTYVFSWFGEEKVYLDL